MSDVKGGKSPTNKKSEAQEGEVMDRKRGPYKEYLKEDLPEIYFANAGNKKATCKKVGIARKTLDEWLRDDPEFAERMNKVKNDDLVDFAESQLIMNIRSGKEASLFFFLKNVKPEKWKERSAMDLNVDPKKALADTLSEIRKEIQNDNKK